MSNTVVGTASFTTNRSLIVIASCHANMPCREKDMREFRRCMGSMHACIAWVKKQDQLGPLTVHVDQSRTGESTRHASLAACCYSARRKLGGTSQQRSFFQSDLPHMAVTVIYALYETCVLAV